jgi:hypothetical protein
MSVLFQLVAAELQGLTTEIELDAKGPLLDGSLAYGSRYCLQLSPKEHGMLALHAALVNREIDGLIHV